LLDRRVSPGRRAELIVEGFVARRGLGLFVHDGHVLEDGTVKRVLSIGKTSCILVFVADVADYKEQHEKWFRIAEQGCRAGRSLYPLFHESSP
jgi:hypothetical protein